MSLVLVSLAAPAAAGQTTGGFQPETDVRQWTVPILHQLVEGAAPAADTTFDVVTPHTLMHVRGTSIVYVEVWMQHQGQAIGSWRQQYDVWVDSAQLPGCEIVLERFGDSTSTRETSFSLACGLPEYLEDGEHRFRIIVTNLAGVPNVVASQVSVWLEQTEEVTTMTNFEAVTGLTALEFFVFPLLAVIGAVVWSRSTDMAVRAFAGVLPLAAGALLLLVGMEAGLGDVWQGTVALAATLLLLGGYLVAMAFIEKFNDAGAGS